MHKMYNMVMNRVNIKELKSELRDKYKKKRIDIPPEEKQIRDSIICKKFLALNSYRYADTILLYAPLKNEINTFEIAKDAFAKGKNVCYPRCIDGNKMVYHYVKNEDELYSGKYGIREPAEDLPVYSPTLYQHSICILPALVYDQSGYRLGYGKGYYDRFLSSFKGIKAGLIYSDFIINEIPRGKFDLPSDIVITEKGVISFAKN